MAQNSTYQNAGEGVLLLELSENDLKDIMEYRRLRALISNKKAILACLHVQRDIAYSERPLAGVPETGK